MLVYDPHERISPEEALDHPYFNSLNKANFAPREYWFCWYIIYIFKFMDFSIDGEEISHSPRTQERPTDPVVLEKVPLSPLRSNTKLQMKGPAINHPISRLDINNKNRQDSQDFLPWHSMNNTFKYHKNKFLNVLSSTSYPLNISSSNKSRKTQIFMDPSGYWPPSYFYSGRRET